jgi:hypothetical protein
MNLENQLINKYFVGSPTTIIMLFVNDKKEKTVIE